jgi:hypothetical protein
MSGDPTSEPASGVSEALFREVNERLYELAEHFGGGKDNSLDLVCECRNGDCAQRIAMTRPAYAALRADATHFAVYPGHADTESDRVIVSTSEYEIVAKLGVAADAARELSQR